MVSPPDLRLGTPADTRLIAEYMLLAGGGLFEQLLDDIVPGIGAEPLLALALAINQADGPFGCDNAVVAEREGRPVGLLLAFPASDYCLPDAVTTFVPSHRLQRIEPLMASRVADSLYIHSLAVLPQERRGGVARALVRAAAELAAAQGLPRVSLHSWQGNKEATALYRRYGFAPCGEVAIAPSPRLCWEGPLQLLAVATAALLERSAPPLN